MTKSGQHDYRTTHAARPRRARRVALGVAAFVSVGVVVLVLAQSLGESAAQLRGVVTGVVATARTEPQAAAAPAVPSDVQRPAAATQSANAPVQATNSTSDGGALTDPLEEQAGEPSRPPAADGPVDGAAFAQLLREGLLPDTDPATLAELEAALDAARARDP